MKVLQLGKFYPIRGGVEKVMWDLTRGLSEAGVSCDMLCAKLPSDGIDEADRVFIPKDTAKCTGENCRYLQLNDNGRVYFVPALAKVAATMIAPAMITRLRSMLRRARRSGEPYDAVHIHHPDPMACIALFLSGFRGRVVLHWHSDILRQQGLLKLYLPFQKWLIRRADIIVGTTPVYVEQSPYLGGVQSKCTYLPIGVEPVSIARALPHCASPVGEGSPEPFSSEEKDGQGDCIGGVELYGKKVVYSMGRLVEYKGFRNLVLAAKYLPEDHVVVIGGGGPLRQMLESQIAEEGLQGRVVLLGRVPEDEVAQWYCRCSVFVLSSVMKTEAFGIVQVEAMSCGKPVVATKIPGSGTSWVNEDGVSGINVEVGDAKAIADAVLAIEADYARYSEGALRRYESMFTFSGMIEKCMNLYR